MSRAKLIVKFTRSEIMIKNITFTNVLIYEELVMSYNIKSTDKNMILKNIKSENQQQISNI